MTQTQTAQKKERCCICKKDAFGSGVGVTLYSISESGKIQDMNETKSSSMQVMVPLCAYHLVLVGEGVACFTTDSRVLFRGKVDYFESKSDEELKRFVEDSLKFHKKTRSKIKMQSLMTELKVAVIVEEARNFYKGINKESLK